MNILTSTYRHPHHSASSVAIIGGGSAPDPFILCDTKKSILKKLFKMDFLIAIFN
ncbi:ATP-binding protein [Neobacillus mesonae]|uniref:ATP-binding protein n=1 Tax=Neobacillus mesonae TaxID=1193713 RepID=UPI003306786E